MRKTNLNKLLPFHCIHTYTLYEDGSVYNEDNGKWIKGTTITKNNRYVKIHLGADKVSKFVPLHRLVATAFIPNPNNLPQVNHIDGNRYNNSASNLEWCTAKHNINHCWKMEMHMHQYGELIGSSKLKEEDALFIYKFRDSGLTPAQFLNRYKYNIKRTAVRNIWTGRSWAKVTGHKIK